MRTSEFIAVLKPLDTLPAELAAIQSDSPSAQILCVIPIRDLPMQVCVVYEIPV